MTAALIAAVTGALAAWTGTMFAGILCRDVVPFEDGPTPVPFKRWHFLIAGAAVGASASVHGWNPAHLAGATLLLGALATCAACDLRCGILPDICTVGVIALTVGFAGWSGNWAPALSATCIAVPFAAVALLTRGRGMGWGDVKLAAAGAAVLGIGGAVVAYVFAATIAYAIARRGAALQRPLPFGAYLAGSIAVGLVAIP